MQVFAKSDIGRERKTNEDFYYVSKPEDKIRLFILADGMGVCGNYAADHCRRDWFSHLG